MKRISGDDPTPRQFVEDALPDHYDVKETITGTIRCVSAKGIDDEPDWDKFIDAVKEYFGEAFREVYHSTCTNHVNFTVYYSYIKLYNLTPDHKLLKKRHMKKVKVVVHQVYRDGGTTEYRDKRNRVYFKLSPFYNDDRIFGSNPFRGSPATRDDAVLKGIELYVIKSFE